MPAPPKRTSFAPKDPTRIAETSEAAKRALAWVKPLDVTPWKLRDKGMKGLKHFVEKVQLLRYLAEWPGQGGPDDVAIADEARALAVATLHLVTDERFHTLKTAEDRRFREDSMSYLRALWLAERFGYDRAPLHAHVAPMLPRFAADARRRGFDQRMAIAFLLTELGHAHHETPEDVFASSRIGSKIAPQYWQQHPSNSYDLTHEIFAMTHRGARPFPFQDPSQAKYAAFMVKSLLGAHMKMNNPDIAAELLINHVQLKLAPGEAVAAGRAFVLKSQNKDGTFGSYDEAALRKRKSNPNYTAAVGGFLHTTMVCVWALMETS